MNRKNDLTTVLQQIEKAAENTESVAGQILAVLKAERIENLHQWDLLVKAAYATAGWSQRIGRPQAGDIAAPISVKQYVSTVRSGFRLHIDWAQVESFGDLRRAIKLRRTAVLALRQAVEEPVALQGVTVREPGALTGAPLHDLYVLRVTLPEADQQRLDVALVRLMEQYTKKAPSHLRLVVNN